MPNTPKPLVLIVEDEVELANLIAEYLEGNNMLTQVCHRCNLAFRFLKNNFANILLLDLTLPDQDGFSFYEELKRNDISVPTIFLTGNASEVSKVKGLELGADDYVTKPFSMAELVARINAVLRRAEVAGDFNLTKNVRLTDEPFTFNLARVDPKTLLVTFPNGNTAKIGRKELGIMAYLANSPSSIVTRKNLIHSVWGIHADIRSRSLDQYIVKIRDLFQKEGVPLDNLKTIHGIGYQYEPLEQTPSE
ncbi:MAG: DNA-binding response regulator [Puniceicoccaceae bacterium]|nr:MAG: DNA-binding response regulator [Puniceicoccaceae bacterium]